LLNSWYFDNVVFVAFSVVAFAQDLGEMDCAGISCENGEISHVWIFCLELHVVLAAVVYDLL
jgi:hypothetical protein